MQRNLIVGILIVVFIFLVYFSMNSCNLCNSRNKVENFQDQSDSGVQIFNNSDAIVKDVINKLKEDESYQELVKNTASQAAQVSKMHTQGLPLDIQNSFVQQLTQSKDFKQNLINSMKEAENIDAFKGPKGSRGTISDMNQDVIVSAGKSLCFGDTSPGSCLNRDDITGLSDRKNKPVFEAVGLGYAPEIEKLQQGSGANLLYLNPFDNETVQVSQTGTNYDNRNMGNLKVNDIDLKHLQSSSLSSQSGVFIDNLDVGTNISNGSFTNYGAAQFISADQAPSEVNIDNLNVNKNLNLSQDMKQFNVNSDIMVAQGKKITAPHIHAEELKVGEKGIIFPSSTGDNHAKIKYDSDGIHINKNLNFNQGGVISYDNSDNQFILRGNLDAKGDIKTNGTPISEAIDAGPQGEPGTSITDISYNGGTMEFTFNDGDFPPIQVSGIKGAPGQRGPPGAGSPGA
jgi:hypothetical protein